MEKRFLTMLVVAAVGVFIGVVMVSKKAEQPVLRQILENQIRILQAQERIESRLVSTGAGSAGSPVQLSQLLAQQRDLQQDIGAIKTAISRAAGQAPQGAQQPPQEDFTTQHDIPVEHSILIGKKDAPVTITEFIDFECPFCARFHAPIVQIMEKYPEDVNLLVKNFPLSFHPNAKPAAKAAFAAAEQGKYAEMINKLLANQRVLTEENFKKYAEELGLDVDQFMNDYQSKDAQWNQYIAKDMRLGSQIGVRGTPTMFINGRKTRARDVAGYEREINEILKEIK